MEFRRVYRSGRRLKISSATLFLLDNNMGYFRVGVTVTRKVGNAVTRNRIKRRVREIFRRRGNEIPGNWDIVVNANPEATSMPYLEMEGEILQSLRRAVRGRR